MHEASLPNYKSGAEMSAPTSRRQTSDGDRPKIHPMPQNPLSLLKKLTAYIKVQNMQSFDKLFSLLENACCLHHSKLPILHNSCFLLRKLTACIENQSVKSHTPYAVVQSLCSTCLTTPSSPSSSSLLTSSYTAPYVSPLLRLPAACC